MTNIFIIHGVQGYPEENWFPWIKKELEELRHKVIIPQFPTPENQTLPRWIEVLKEYETHITPEAIFVGHSLGVPFTLNVVEKHQIKAAFLVAGFVGSVENEFNESMKTFAQKPFSWDQIKANCKKFTVFHSDNDPYIKFKKAHELAQYLNTEVTLIKNAGHFNTTAGYQTFDALMKTIIPYL